ncbi:DNA-methyltransferase [Bacillus velezensis]|uniref:DNA-methyltransferase n=1 Tax=Bacillus velezensis TaxID=492670 RepID=UPI003A88CFFA
MQVNKVYNVDCLEGMEQFLKHCGENSIDLTVTSPPYNIGKVYEKKKSIEKYLEFSADYLNLVYKLLKNKSSLMLQVGCYIDKNSNNIPLSYHLYPYLKKIGFNLRQEIVWSFRGGMQAKKKLTGQNEKILWLYKGQELPYFNLDSIRIKEWKTMDKRNNPNGKNPTDVWEINRVAGNSKEKMSHPCQFPTSMIDRIIKGWCVEGGLVLDPFMGSGTTAVSAINTGRNYLGFELDRTYFEESNQRIAEHVTYLRHRGGGINDGN